MTEEKSWANALHWQQREKGQAEAFLDLPTQVLTPELPIQF